MLLHKNNKMAVFTFVNILRLLLMGKGTTDFSLLHSVQKGSGTHPASYAMSTRARA
jgi:hypothetical protein